MITVSKHVQANVPYGISPISPISYGSELGSNGNSPGPYLVYSLPRAASSFGARSSRSDEQDSVTLNQKRRAALTEVDEAHFSRFHAKVVAIVGAGFFTDAYDTFVIDIAITMLGLVYGHPHTDSQGTLTVKLSPTQETSLKIAGPIGTFVGMLVFGYLGDRIGRKRAYGVELIIIIFSVTVQAMLGQAQAVSIVNSLIVWRFIMGVGIGGDYPTSAVIASEFAPVAKRGRMITGVFGTQGLGQLTGALVCIITVYAYRDSLNTVSLGDVQVITRHIDQMWRVLIGFGCIPGALALIYRFTIPETPRFTMDIARNVDQANQDVDTFLKTGGFHVDPNARVERVDAPIASFADWRKYLGAWRNLGVLVGTCYSWFALDIAFYGLSLNSTIIMNGVLPTRSTDSVWNQLHTVAARNTIPICAGLVPGYVGAYLLIDRWGRRPLQFAGFGALFVLLVIMGFGFEMFTKSGGSTGSTGPQRAFVVLYCLASFFLNCGPNTTTFIIPGECFPTRYRSTMNGVAAASGKLGAIISQLVVYALLKNSTDATKQKQGIKLILIVYGFFMLSGIGSTLLLPETKNRSLEEISNEDQVTFIAGPA